MRRCMSTLLILVLLLTACNVTVKTVQETLPDGSYLSSITDTLSQAAPAENAHSVSITLRQEDGSEVTAQIPLDTPEDSDILPVDSWEEYRQNAPFLPALRQRQDGSWVLVTLNRHGQLMSRIRSAVKTVSYYSADGTLQWTVRLTASFRWDGLNAVCTGSDAEVMVADENSWQLLEQTVNDGLCTVTFRRTTLGVPTSTPSFTFQLTCDPDGSVT